MALNLNEFKRFEKQIILKKVGISGQKKIKRAKVLIIGMGGLGCPLLTYLASSGVNNIGIVDHDKIELGNLNRQVLFNTSDLGKYKVNQAKVEIKKIYNLLMKEEQFDKLAYVAHQMQKKALEQVAVADLIREALDIYVEAYEEEHGIIENPKT